MLLEKTHVQRQFDRSAASYDYVAGMQRDIVDLLVAQLPAKASSIVDLGCGTGYALNKLERKYPMASMHGLDLAPGMLAQAEMVAPGTDLIQGDLESLPFSDGSMDLCFSSSAIQWCDAKRALSEIARINMPGGTVVVSSFLRGTLSAWRALWGNANQAAFLTEAQFVETMREVGFTNIQCRQQTIVQKFDDFDKAVASIRDLGAGDATSSRSRGLMGRREFMKIKNRVNQLIERDGAISLEYQVILAQAIKSLNADV